MQRSFNTIAKKITEARERKGYTQAELARFIGYKNGQFISNVERGKCGIPIEKIFLMSRILGTNPMIFAQAMITDFQTYVYNQIDEDTPPELPCAPKTITDRVGMSNMH